MSIAPECNVVGLLPFEVCVAGDLRGVERVFSDFPFNT